MKSIQETVNSVNEGIAHSIRDKNVYIHDRNKLVKILMKFKKKK